MAGPGVDEEVTRSGRGALVRLGQGGVQEGGGTRRDLAEVGGGGGVLRGCVRTCVMRVGLLYTAERQVGALGVPT